MTLRAALVAALLASCAGPAAPGRAKVALRCDEPDAELTVDGVPHGDAKEYAGPHRLLLAPGVHVLVLRSHGAVQSRSISVGPQDNLTLNIAFGAAGRAASQGDSP